MNECTEVNLLVDCTVLGGQFYVMQIRLLKKKNFARYVLNPNKYSCKKSQSCISNMTCSRVHSLQV